MKLNELHNIRNLILDFGIYYFYIVYLHLFQIIGLLSLVGGLIMGFSTRMLVFGDFLLFDLLATTPVTFFMLYGCLYLVIASIGCFSTLSINVRLILLVRL